MSLEAHGRQALTEVDSVLGQRPTKDDRALATATMCLAAARDDMIRLQRGAGATHEERERLARLNAVISVVLGMHFPLGEAPWDELEKARAWLADLIEEGA